MPTLGWNTLNPAPPQAPVLVMASRFELRSLRDVPRFLLLSTASWRQVRTAPGAYGASLIARPLGRVFYTLSAWQDRAALSAYARSDPHGDAMRAMRPRMRPSTFVFWETDAEHLPITWEEAERRLAEKARSEAAGPDDRPA
ncbi:DUF3291 domain-containing protein [Streptomyces sp. NPDC017254]|uniref:DUF3291 domain-containing protein n=1 Tax=unclassified Streptomyces TaxID=2593676 RepID=UPI00378953B5